MRKYKPLQLGIVLRMIIRVTLSFSFFSVLSVKTGDSHPFLSYFFVKKIPLSRRVAYVLHGSMGESVSQ